VKLSIIIVNYNVKYFLEQCLQSVHEALRNMEAEVFVVDNNSVDGSCQMVKEKFPRTHLIENTVNVGFSKANNLAIKKTKGEYILLLNPDTLAEEHIFEKCIEYMDNNPKTGALGVKMIDGKGNYLPESKRGLPTPWVSFCKIFGLSTLFPKSRLFGRYHLSYLSKDEINNIEILPGAFMLIRKKVLNQVGLLDETFFMYGEDIDLSYRIIKAGYKNVYFPNSTIIHYKGESTKKASINYVVVFYNAMIIFAKKHFSKKNARLYSFFINLAIYFRASLSILKRVFHNIFFPFIDATMIYSGFILIRPYWENYKFSGSGSYPDFFLETIVPSYIVTWIISIFISGGYTKPFNMLKVRRGILLGTVSILLIYALLPESLRFSRALIIMGTVWTLVLTHLIRLIINLFKHNEFKTIFKKIKKRIVIVGERNEAERVYSILKFSQIVPDLVGIVNPGAEQKDNYIGNVKQLKDIIRINNIEEIIFCGKDISSREIIKNMLNLKDDKVEYKIAPPESLSVIGSNSINTAGDLYTVSFNSVTKPVNRRKKRIFDLCISLFLLILSPLMLMIYKSRKQFIINSLLILRGKLTIVGFVIESENDNEKLKMPGVFNPLDMVKRDLLTKEAEIRLNSEYVRNYSVQTDLNILVNNILSFDRKI